MRPSVLMIRSNNGSSGAPSSRIRANTVERRLLNARGNPNFNIRFFALNKRGEFAGVAMYHAGETKFAVCTENGAKEMALEPLLQRHSLATLLASTGGGELPACAGHSG